MEDAGGGATTTTTTPARCFCCLMTMRGMEWLGRGGDGDERGGAAAGAMVLCPACASAFAVG
eukprot:3939489-Rhodomonas_salina.1